MTPYQLMVGWAEVWLQYMGFQWTVAPKWYKHADCFKSGKLKGNSDCHSFKQNADWLLSEITLNFFAEEVLSPLGPWFHSCWSGRPAKREMLSQLSRRIRVWDFCCKLGLKWTQAIICHPLLSDNLIDALTQRACIHLHPPELLKCLLRR